MTKNYSVGNILLGVLAIATIRDFLEVTLQGLFVLYPEDPLYSLKNYFLHYNSFYFLIFASLPLVLFLFLRKNASISLCYKLGALAMTLIWVGPLFDYFVVGSFEMFYPRDPLSVVCNIHHLADPSYNYEGLSKGMRLEIILVGLGGGYYLYHKTKKVFRSVCGGICLSATCLAIGLLVPFLTQYYEYGFNFGYHKLYDSTLLNQGFVIHGVGSKIALLYLFLSGLLFAVAYYFRNPKRFISIINNFRWSRSIHYILLFIAGLVFIYNNPPVPDSTYESHFDYLTTIWNHPIDLFGIFMASLSIFLSFQSAVIFNDICDYDIDIVSNATRPLVNKSIPLKEYSLIGKLFAILALTIAFCISETFFFLVLLYHFFAFLYSTPPFRLRKFFLLSNIVLATIFTLTFHAGAAVLISNYQFENIPPYITFGLIICYALALVAKDSKDYKGDKKSNIQTLYTLFGKKSGNVLTSLFICSSILLTPFLLHSKNLFAFSVAICISFLLVITKIKNNETKEILVISLYYTFMLILFFSLVKS